MIRIATTAGLLCTHLFVAACGGDARAAPDAAPKAEPAAGESSGGAAADAAPSDEPQDDGFDDGAEGEAAAGRAAVDQELAAAKELVDAAIAKASDRGELERLALAQQRSELDQAKAEVEARLGSIESLETRIDEILGAGKVERDHRRERVDMLANLVATMSPSAAATMLAQMSDAQAQDLLLSVAQNDKRKAAKLIATMPPDRAAAISQRYLSRDPEAIGDATATPSSDLPPRELPAPPKSPPVSPPAEPVMPETPAEAPEGP